jgi:pyruvate ferredoxin oxidoreductase beta subunit
MSDESACVLFDAGHRACAGCAAAMAARLILDAAGKDTIIVSATGCMEVFSTPYPETAWNVPWIHSLFENNSAVASGVVAALKKQGRSENVIAVGGDGATFDIGILCLSGAFERGCDFTYICYDNEAYMNTGIQRSGATPYDASTTTSPSGSCSFGNKRPKKDLPAILAAHGAPYVATSRSMPPAARDGDSKGRRRSRSENWPSRPVSLSAMRWRTESSPRSRRWSESRLKST